ncbi:hypothetical protein A2V56_05570 [Candidatus Woesebacteria bacterium RBG_19FT_COMBO_42_9]|mgnify:CR=1 FL=1|uniref:Uncharacterized protein n=1 Tax=Candidatus Woesebacteria bacterium RBG_16_42_24 TaxID=1802485 RepID=A0A1F7XN69_9BACT|nr:MAG: hypothetical protein A2V97_02950 [Candidatus Woesebacteria bacterium RBG_16_42_24]OGM16082.1 MAG: hypothetical protein A2V56_05570 [Candidatus Woesebacteria bacterium RBG_19FT_COMBO_42_9]OGM68389.1 MAG: hypothetical protein A2985_01060 [Candidatus Woesebacteria bacterium RIFCSPLOWO2_01_FULL_43_11]
MLNESEKVSGSIGKKFSSEAQRTLEQRGFLIYKFHKRTIGEMAKEIPLRLMFQTTEDFFRLASSETEAAIDPNQVYLPGSCNQDLDTQIKRVSDLRIWLRNRLGRSDLPVSLTVGTLPDYIELVLEHQKHTGESLFKPWVNTSTAQGEFIYIVGAFLPKMGLFISRNLEGGRFPAVCLAPYIVPYIPPGVANLSRN